jgi:UPF0176 protein
MSPAVTIIAFYKFVHLSDFGELKPPLLEFLVENEIRGTILLAPEGINGTVSGSADAIDNLISRLRTDTRFADIEFKFSRYDRQPFELPPN